MSKNIMLYYVADPMCSWCWGFQANLMQIKEALPSELPLVYVMGGLARDSAEPMPEDVKAYVKNAWRQVTAETGAVFNWDFWKVCEPRRSTYPSC
ncbi:MAG: DsbA family protein, partial [Candidatus Latescibacterota bacterium]